MISYPEKHEFEGGRERERERERSMISSFDVMSNFAFDAVRSRTIGRVRQQ